jgi:DNA invertase Pin-like site-specific DNA recombinase
MNREPEFLTREIVEAIHQDQIEHARELIDEGESRQYVADLLNVERVTLYRELATL